MVEPASERLPSDVSAALQAWMAEELERSPVTATALGVAGHDDQLGDFGPQRWEAQPARDARWAAHLGGLVGRDHDLDDRIDITSVLAELAGRAVMEDWQAWRRDPATYLNPCLQGPFSLFLHRGRPEPELVAAAISRLRQVPGVLAAARANLVAELVPPLFVDRAVGACGPGANYLRHLLPAEVTDPGLRADLAQAAGAAADAVEGFAAFLAALAPEAHGAWAIGERRYDALLADRQLLTFDSSHLQALGRQAWDELDAEMRVLANAIDPGAGGWHAVVADLSGRHPADPEAMRAAYADSCARAREFCAERGLVTFAEGEECLVEPAPVFQRPVLAVASYAAPPPFSTSRTGHLFVPYPPADADAATVEQRLSDNGFFSIPTIAVHEAYPGHHWQLSWAAGTTRPVRKALRTPYFVEGWALYAEHMMHTEGFFDDPRTALCHLDARVFRAVRMEVDPALHAGELDFDHAVALLTTRASLPESVARAEVSRYAAAPTQAASYLTGSLEIERLRHRWFREGRGDLRSFHDRVAADPGLPTALVELSVFGTPDAPAAH